MITEICARLPTITQPLVGFGLIVKLKEEAVVHQYFSRMAIFLDFITLADTLAPLILIKL